jgi:tRNA modification GTPase
MVDAIAVSVVTGEGLETLRGVIRRELMAREELRDAPAISNLRHLELVDAARASLDRARRALADGATEELVLTDLSDARESLELITGRRAPDDLLRHIFARFCIGK